MNKNKIVNAIIAGWGSLHGLNFKFRPFKKTWKIGEYSQYGICQLVGRDTKLTVNGIDYDTKRIVDSRTFNIEDYGYSKDSIDFWSDIELYIEDQITSYYGSKLTDFAKKKTVKTANKLLSK